MALHKNVPIQAIGLALYASTSDAPDIEAALPEVTKTQWLDYHSETDVFANANNNGQQHGETDDGINANETLSSHDSNPLKNSTVTSLIGKNVLIVDEVDDTRRTLSFAVQELQKDADRQKKRWEAHNSNQVAPATRIGKYPDI